MRIRFLFPVLAFASVSLLSACGGNDGFGTSPSPTAPPTPVPSAEPTPEPTPEITVTSLQALADFPIGVAVPAGDFDSSVLDSVERQNIVETHFSEITAENIMKPSYLHPTEGNFDFTDADALINYAAANGLDVHGHTLVWHSQIPDWMVTYSGDEAAWTTMMENHVTTIATHFAGDVVSWDVVNEALNEDGSLRNSVWLQNVGSDFIALAFEAAEAADANADLYYNDFNLENNGDKLDGAISLIQGLTANSVPIDGIGFQMHVTMDFPSVQNIRAAFSKVVDTGLKLKLTELDVSRSFSDNLQTVTELSESYDLQLYERYRQIVAAYLDVVPAAQRGGITVWGITDDDSWLSEFRNNTDFHQTINTDEPWYEFGLLFNRDYTPKLALQGFADGLAE